MLHVLMHCLLLELATGARDEQRLTGAACALGLAGALSGAPLAALAWRRACALSKPQATLASAPPPPAGPPLLPLNLSHEGRLLAVAFLPPPAPAARCLGVDVMSTARGARALATAAASGDCAGEALLRGCSGGDRSGSAPSRLPTPRALAGAAAAPARLFAARWTLMEAVLKARGQGLAVQGAGAAVLAEAVEEAEAEAEAEAGADALAPALWGARAPAGGWDSGSAQRAAKAAAAAAAVAAATAPASDGQAAPQRVPYAVLARFRGPGWRAVTCALSWPTPESDTLLTFALLD